MWLSSNLFPLGSGEYNMHNYSWDISQKKTKKAEFDMARHVL